MGKIWIIIQREYISRVKRRAFIITTLLAPVGLFLLIAASVFISTYSDGKTDVAIIDDSGLFKDIPIPNADDQTVYFHKVNERYDSVAAKLPHQKIKEYKGIIYIPANFDPNQPNKPHIAYRYVETPGRAIQQLIDQKMTTAVQMLKSKMLNASKEQIEATQQEVKLNPEPLDNDNKKKQAYGMASYLVGMVMGFAIYISLFFYGTMIMKGVMEEKTNRIVEVLTSSVKPFQLLMGKIVGIGAVGLTQFVLWGILMFITAIIAQIVFAGYYSAHATASMAAAQGTPFDPESFADLAKGFATLPFLQIGILFPIFFLFGFLLYGSLFAAVGAAMGEDGDQQALMIPVTTPIIISIYIALNVVNNPESKLGFWGSIIPLTSPVVMSTLLPFRPDWWQIALSLLFLIAGFVFTTWIAARIYRIGILMYGKKITMKEMAKWIFAKD